MNEQEEIELLKEWLEDVDMENFDNRKRDKIWKCYFDIQNDTTLTVNDIRKLLIIQIDEKREYERSVFSMYGV